MATTEAEVTEAQIADGHAIYTSFNLNFYNLFILGISNKIFWKCPTQRILAFYNEHVTANHLDIGVGTGYYLDRCRFPSAKPRLAIMDINEPSLQRTAKLIARYSPEVYRADMFKPEQVQQVRGKFDSVALCYLFHCMPGNLRVKLKTLEQLLPILNDGATIFGATILGTGTNQSLLTKLRLKQLNSEGILHNLDDNRADLSDGLGRYFDDRRIEVIGHVALFSARYRARTP